MAHRHAGRKRVGSVMIDSRISSWLGGSHCALGLSGVFTRGKNAGFFVRVFRALSAEHTQLRKAEVRTENRPGQADRNHIIIL